MNPRIFDSVIVPSTSVKTSLDDWFIRKMVKGIFIPKELTTKLPKFGPNWNIEISFKMDLKYILQKSNYF